MNRTEKAAVVARLRERIAKLPTIYLTDFTGISVKQMTDLRRRFRAAGVEYVVVKNTLAERAFREESVVELGTAFAGPTGFVLAEDPVTAAKIITDFQKEAASFKVTSGLVEGRPVSPDDVRRLATLPSRDGLLGQVAGSFQAPLQGFVGALNGLLYQMAGALEALCEQRASAA